jgi:hypothetical protein
MKNAKRTPGPWQVTGMKSATEYHVDAIDEGRFIPVAVANRSDAALIAAAPEMLAALESVLELHTRGIINLPCSAYDTILLPIKKTKGKK